MKFQIKQQLFRLFDTFDIKDENGRLICTVSNDGILAHSFTIRDDINNVSFRIDEKMFRFLPTFEIYLNNERVGTIKSRFNLFVKRLNIDLYNLSVEGGLWDFNFRILDQNRKLVAQIERKIFTLTDTYEINCIDERYNVLVILICLCIDAINCHN